MEMEMDNLQTTCISGRAGFLPRRMSCEYTFGSHVGGPLDVHIGTGNASRGSGSLLFSASACSRSICQTWPLQTHSRVWSLRHTLIGVGIASCPSCQFIIADIPLVRRGRGDWGSIRRHHAPPAKFLFSQGTSPWWTLPRIRA